MHMTAMVAGSLACEMSAVTNETRAPHIPWNKGKVTGQKPPLKPREVWAIRVRLQISARIRDLAPVQPGHR